MKTVAFVSVAVLTAFSTVASAQWSDNFDSYAPGSINGLTAGGPSALGTWQGWDNVAAAAGEVVSTPNLSAPRSQRITTGDDSVHRYQGVTSGAWTYSTNIFIPTGNTGDSDFILLNQYNNAGPYQWSVQLQFDSTSGLVFDNLETNTNTPSIGSAQLPIIRDTWVPLRVEFNITANTQSSFYNNTLIYTGTWKRGAAGAQNALAAVDLFHESGTGNVFYDNFNLVPAPSSLALLAMGGLVAGRRRR